MGQVWHSKVAAMSLLDRLLESLGRKPKSSETPEAPRAVNLGEEEASTKAPPYAAGTEEQEDWQDEGGEG